MVAGWDRTATSWLADHRGPVVTRAAGSVLLATGPAGAVLTLGVVTSVLRRRTGRRRPGLVLAVVVVAAKVAGSGLKSLVDRGRPPEELLAGAPSTSAAFPSGHALTGGVLLSGAGLLLAATAPPGHGRAAARAAGALAALSVGASRVLLGYHWPTDVIASWCLAGAVAPVVPRLALRTPCAPVP